uniref:B30.2/SPRY domain-containing protein n=1 Tax=Lates calcarifer TaxID=8187 RepID=A0A4W6FSV3_LATCA
MQALSTISDTKDWSKIRVYSDLCMQSVRRAMSYLTAALTRLFFFPESVTFDQATAGSYLVVTESGKRLKYSKYDREVDDTPQRFDMFGSVLGRNSLTSGKSYWEVEVGNKTGWDLGITRGDANRKGKLSLNPDNGYWVTVHYEEEKFAALTTPPIRLSLEEKPEKVGVFVDYEEGIVSFYNVTAQSHIYSFTDCLFRDELFPYLSPHVKQDDKNGNPLIISAVKQCA